MEAATCIQRRLRGVLGRRRATEERWRRLQVCEQCLSHYPAARRQCRTIYRAPKAPRSSSSSSRSCVRMRGGMGHVMCGGTTAVAVPGGAKGPLSFGFRKMDGTSRCEPLPARYHTSIDLFVEARVRAGPPFRSRPVHLETGSSTAAGVLPLLHAVVLTGMIYAH